MNPDLKELGILIGLARRHKDYLQKDLAKALGVTTQAISSWESGKSRISPKYANELAEILEIDLKIILNPDLIPKGRSCDVPIIGYPELRIMNHKKVRYDDFYLRDERIEVPISITKNGSPDSFIIGCQVSGASMEPVLKDGSIVVFDFNPIHNIVDGDMYVIRHYDDIKVRLIFSLGPKKTLKCYNSEFVDEIVDATDKNFTILGKVLWGCTKY